MREQRGIVGSVLVAAAVVSAAVGCSGDGPDAVALLAVALEPYEEAAPVRVTTATGQTLNVEALGVDSSTVADPDEPTMIVESVPGGDSHIVIRIGRLFGDFAGGDPAAAADLADVEVALWTVGDMLTIDSSDYDVIVDLNPAAELGPFAPGIGVVDLQRLGDLGGEELAQALVGGTIPDLDELGTRLPAALTDLRQDDDDPRVLRGTATLADITEAQGGDVTITARAAATGVAANFGVGVDEVAAFYERYYRELEVDVTVTLDDAGALSSLRVVSDLSGIWSELFSPDSGIDLGATEGDLAAAAAAYADAVWLTETVSTFEVAPDVVITPPSGDHEDRTDLALAYFAEIVP